MPYLQLDRVSQISHNKIFKDIPNYFVKYGIFDQNYVNLLNGLRLNREAYSYRLPLGGSFLKEENEELDIDVLFKDLSQKLPIIMQVSELLSYLSYFAWNKKVGELPDEYEKYQTECDRIFFSFLEIHDHLSKYCLIDNDDYSRQGWMLRNFKSPFPLSWITTAKLCEDLECGWEFDEDDAASEDDYNINEVRGYIAGCIGGF
ncbi:MAG: hypothetical protein WB792_10635 [Desulfobacterales bacterium]